jgi:carbon-monoxide dehydrogenase medium subunit
MLTHVSEYHRPTDLAEALRLLARPDVVTVPLAGGTELVAAGIPGAQAVVDLRDLGLNTIDATSGGLRLGAMVTLQTVIDDPCSATFARGILVEAARRSATRNVRNIATLGGTVATADPLDELLLALLVLDAQVTLADTIIKRSLPLADFLADPAKHLPRGTLIVELALPTPPRGFGIGMAQVARTPADRPIVAASVTLATDNGKCTHARLALAGASTRPLRLPEIETALVGQKLREKHLERLSERILALVGPPSDFRASADYRREMAGVVARRALLMAWQQACGGMR